MISSQINSKWDITWLNQEWDREWFHERIRNKDNLLITIGDSWTWGESLGKIDIKKNIYDDYNHRTSNIYGYHLSNLLDTDWVNIGVCGASNLNILLAAKDFIETIDKKYAKILVVVTLTESGRELKSNNFLKEEKKYNSIKGTDWPSFNDILKGIDLNKVLIECFEQKYLIGYDLELYHSIKDFKDINDFLLKYEAFTFRLIKKFFKNFIVARNFTNCYYENKSILGDSLLPKSWTTIISNRGNLSSYPDVKILSNIALTPVLEYTNLLPREQLISLLDSAQAGITWLENSPYNAKIATKHPLEQAHRWWAEYLYQNINL